MWLVLRLVITGAHVDFFDVKVMRMKIKNINSIANYIINTLAKDD